MLKAILSVVLLLALPGMTGAAAHAANIEVRGVEASEPGKKADIPGSLSEFKKHLSGTVYGSFKDLGEKNIKGKGGSAAYGAYSLEVNVVKPGPKSVKVEVTIKEGGKALGTPASMDLKKGETVMLKAGEREKQTIFLLTLKE